MTLVQTAPCVAPGRTWEDHILAFRQETHYAQIIENHLSMLGWKARSKSSRYFGQANLESRVLVVDA